MQKISTRLFVWASLIFGVTGILMVLTLPPDGIDANASDLHKILMKILFTMVFIILPSFALSIASKYLSNKS
jgi:hypothetical protein